MTHVAPRTDLDYFARVPFLPDPMLPVDRWFQVPDGRSVREIGYLIDHLAGLGLTGEVLVDPFAGAGGAAVAAAQHNLAFRGYDVYPPRLLYTLAKCVSFGADATLGRRLVSARAARTAHELIEGYRSDPAVLTLLGALAVARTDPDLTARTDRHEILIDDVWSTPSTPMNDLDAWCHAVGDPPAGLPVDERPAIVITSPPHPRTRARFQTRTTESVQLSEELLGALGRLRRSWEDVPPPRPDSIRAMFQFLRHVHPATSGVVIEFENVPDEPSSQELTIQAGAAFGFEILETVITYLEAPDVGPGRVGGFIVFRRPPEAL
jgi:hypothetical protein